LKEQCYIGIAGGDWSDGSVKDFNTINWVFISYAHIDGITGDWVEDDGSVR